MKADDLLRGVITPALTALKLRSWQAEQLCLGTAIAESNLESLFQIGGGPARGLWQIEPFTARDVLRRYLGRRLDLRWRLKQAVYPLGGMTWRTNWTDEALSHALRVNLALGAAVCRLIYLWVPEPIPDDLEGQAAYWVDHYNKGGAGTVEHYIKAWEGAER
ncbi:hypothetical protein LCGC14_0896000 [marine sediment metagenome]|uniref:Transglycosylase SLT domain-containing protein n=1 Tax=marine sediment metagenome TaxID=412755 RepID=A0A0F9RH34_9ZZZZ